jgi:hypothetical protein
MKIILNAIFSIGLILSANVTYAVTDEGESGGDDLEAMVACLDSCLKYCNDAYTDCPKRNGGAKLCKILWLDQCPNDCASECHAGNGQIRYTPFPIAEW